MNNQNLHYFRALSLIHDAIKNARANDSTHSHAAMGKIDYVS
ncbi:hypothetical protein [Photorhabdus luminescens]|nr:hypothetical protein [Photorhabdus luminescens]